jgi:hypothetical protein
VPPSCPEQENDCLIRRRVTAGRALKPSQQIFFCAPINNPANVFVIKVKDSREECKALVTKAEAGAEAGFTGKTRTRRKS